jgi:Fe-S cluster assembly iron-binding protein IscA
MTTSPILRITPRAAAELLRLSGRWGSVGTVTLALVGGACETWALDLGPQRPDGVPLARTDGITVLGLSSQEQQLRGLVLDFREDLDGGGFLVRGGDRIRSCACGASFTRLQG